MRVTNLRGQRSLSSGLVSGPDTDTIGISALSVQRFLQNHHPRYGVDGEEAAD